MKLADAADTRSLEGAFLEQTIQRLRTISGMQARVEDLHQRLLVADKQALAELKGYERPSISRTASKGHAPMWQDSRYRRFADVEIHRKFPI